MTAKDRIPRSLFTARPDASDDEPNFQIVRTPPKGKGGGVVITHDLIGCKTHYWKRRTLPCNPQSCEACDEGHPCRWHGYLALWNQRTKRIHVLEITSNAVPQIDDYFKRYGTLRGAEIIVERVPQKPNGKVFATLTQSGIPGDLLPPHPDLETFLTKLWDVSYAQSAANPRYANKPTNGAPIQCEP
jgi:hypothetical protein